VYRLSQARAEYVLAVFALYIGSLVIVGARWRGFIRALGGDAGVLRATLATLGGIAVANVATSTRLSGEVCRIALVRTTGRVTWRQGTIAAVWDRLSELPPIIVVAVVAVFAVPDIKVRARTPLITVAVAAAVIGAVVLTWRFRKTEVSAVGWRERLTLDRIKPGLIAAGVGYSTLLWIQDVLRLTCAALAVGVSVSPAKIAALSILAMIGGLLPSIGGVGPVEGGLIGGLVAFGVDLPTATAVTAVERAVSYAFSTVAGALVVFLMGGRSLWTAVRSRASINHV